MTASQGWLLRHLTSTSMGRGHVFGNMMLMVQIHPGQLKETIKSGSDISMFYPINLRGEKTWS